MVNSSPNLPDKISGLDGLRGLSIALVVFAHAATTHQAPAIFDKPYFASLGNIGVRLFFVISGFLITTLLLRELHSTGSVSLKSFYIRRSFRILPAVLFYIAIIWFAYLAGWIELRQHLASRTVVDSAIPDLIRALTFTYNYVHDYNWYFNHLWSLSVEEQFYLLWPLTIFYLGVKRAAWIGIILMLIGPAIRYAMLAYLNTPLVALSREFQAVADALMTGCLASIFFNSLLSKQSIRHFIEGVAGWVGGLMVLLAYASGLWSREFAATIGQSIANIGGVLILLHVVCSSGSIIGRVLTLRPLMYLGTISYSLYLWQQPFLFYSSKSWATSFPQNLLLSAGAALLSFYLIEKPFLKLRHRFEAKKVSPEPAT